MQWALRIRNFLYVFVAVTVIGLIIALLGFLSIIAMMGLVALLQATVGAIGTSILMPIIIAALIVACIYTAATWKEPDV